LKYLKILAKYALIGVIFFFLSHNLFANWSQVQHLHLNFNFLYGFLSFLSVMLGWLLNVWAWQKVLAGLKHLVSFRDAFFILFRANLGKYIPGNFWQVVGSAYYAAGKGIPEGAAIAASVITQIYSVIAGLALFAVAALAGLFGHSWAIISSLKWIAIPFLIFLLIIGLRPRLGQPILNRILRIFKRKQVEIHLSFGRAIEIFFLLLIACFLSGLGIWLFANAIIPTGISLWISLSAVLAVAAIIGFLAVFAPGGLGVREGVVALFLASIPAFVAPLPSAIAMGYRVVIIISELFTFGLTWVVK
jgi:uncharacterized membrane protein YbhN (UPF0104 family)